MNNDANEYPYRICLDQEDPLFQQKEELLGNETIKRSYRVMADISEETTHKLMSYLRFIEFDGNMMVLHSAKMRDENGRGNQHMDSDSDDMGVKNYKAENISVLSVANERRVMTKLRELSATYLKNYKDTLENDNAMLEKDDAECYLNFN